MKKPILMAFALFLLAIITVLIGWKFWNIDQKDLVAPQPSVQTSEEVSPEDLVSGGPPKDGIPSIDQPIFESVAEANRYLDDDLLGVGVVSGSERRFYPFQILVWHEIVNDTIGKTPILVSYCPLCGTAIVFDRRVQGETHEFGVSGKLYNSNLVMYDRETDSYWSQAAGKAILGPLAGAELTLYPTFENASWKDWKARYPDSKILSRNTGYDRDYTRTPYQDYEETNAVWFPINNHDDRLPAKAWIAGVTVAGAAKAYPLELMDERRVVNDLIGDTPLLVVKDPQNGVKAFARGRRIFDTDPQNRLRDRDTQSVWDYDGVATSGTLTGTRLTRLPVIPSYWFSWAAFYPETLLLE